MKHSHVAPYRETSPETIRPLSHHQGVGTGHLSLQLPEQWSIHPVFHVDLLTPYKETEFHRRNFERPLPDLVDGEEEYEVERVLDSRRFGRGRQYST